MSAVAVFLGGVLIVLALLAGVLSAKPSALATAFRYGVPVGAAAASGWF